MSAEFENGIYTPVINPIVAPVVGETTQFSLDVVNESGSQLAQELDNAAAIVEDDLQLAELGGELRRYAETLRQDQFKLVVVGDFNRGKSTLLNAILGEALLPQRITPSTAIITILEYGDEGEARLHFKDATCAAKTLTLQEFKTRYVLDPNEVDGHRISADRFDVIDYAVVTYPNPLLRHRVQLVDSPGLDEHPARTLRTLDFLREADAVIMVLDATELLEEQERSFIEEGLRARGLGSIFFVINKWNLIEQSVVDPADLEKQYADLEERIRTTLLPFCAVNGQDLSAQRIFRVNALGAVQARQKKPINMAQLEQSEIPQFEAALRDFLVHDRRQARAGKLLAERKRVMSAVDRVLEMQAAGAQKSLSELEAEIKAISPQLERLRGIRQHIVNYLKGESNMLQERLVASFGQALKGIDAGLEDAVEQFDLSEVFKGSLVWQSFTDWARADEDKLATRIERSIRPQVEALLKARLDAWQTAVRENEMNTLKIDVEKHLRGEAAEYQRVMQQIESHVGVVSTPLNIQELVSSWLNNADEKPIDTIVDLSGIQAFGDLSWLVGTIVTEIMAEVFFHLSLAWLPIVGLIISALRWVWREAMLRDKVKYTIVEAVRKGLAEAYTKESVKIRASVKKGFGQLINTIAGNIDIEIGGIEAGLQAILDKRRDETFSAEHEQNRLKAVRGRLQANGQRIQALLAAY